MCGYGVSIDAARGGPAQVNSKIADAYALPAHHDDAAAREAGEESLLSTYMST